MVKGVATNIITVAVFMGSLVACSGSDSEVTELRAELEDVKEQLKTQESVEEDLTPAPPTPTPFPTVQPAPTPTPTTMAEPTEPIEGLRTLYIGHSFGRPFASELTSFTAYAGIQNHVQEIVFRGGPNGSPQSLWEDTKTRLEIQNILLEGDTDLLIMICCSENFRESRESDWAVKNWIEYALSVNPDTDFALALPWPDFPEEYENSEVFSEPMINAHKSVWHPFIDELRDLYPDTKIQSIFHGRAAFDLRELFETNSLPEISEMTAKRPLGLFTDKKGHAGQVLLDLGTLIWLGTIYDIDLNTFPVDDLRISGEPYTTDLVAMAQEILEDEKRVDAGE